MKTCLLISSIAHLYLQKAFDWLPAYWTPICLKPQNFCTLAAHALHHTRSNYSKKLKTANFRHVIKIKKKMRGKLPYADMEGQWCLAVLRGIRHILSHDQIHPQPNSRSRISPVAHTSCHSPIILVSQL